MLLYQYPHNTVDPNANCRICCGSGGSGHMVNAVEYFLVMCRVFFIDAPAILCALSGVLYF